MNTYRILFIILTVLLMSACQATKDKQVPVAPVLPPPVQMTPEEVSQNPGSMFEDANANYLFADNRARRVGDIVFVNVSETTTAQNKAETSTDKESSISLGVGSFFGKDRLQVGPLGVPGALGGTANPLLSATTSSSFEGEGETKRENTFTTTIACRVLKVLPGGLLQIEGARETRVNDETQFMVLTGMVRASDVQANNSLKSSQVANARIAYYGEGAVADKQRPGWFVRLMDNVWPF